jgi:hypothetical protein
MEQYINQLVEDILAAHRTKYGYVEEIDDSFEAHIAEVERYLSGEGEQKITDICGLYAEQFPPKQRLNENQMKQVVEAYQQMLESWNIGVYMPENVPIDIRYELLTGTLDHSVYVPNDEYSHVGIDLCSYVVDSCPFGNEYCTCKEDMEEWESEGNDMDNFEIDEDELPF